jgi:glycosyltransferase involved in cell wall biosynthesis
MLRVRAQERGLDNVLFIDSVPKQEVVRYWSLLDVSIIHLKKTKLFASVIPSKLFECMGMGIPVLHGVAGESAEIVKQESIGIVFEPENAKELCLGIMRLHDDESFHYELRRNCLKAAPKFDRIEHARRMLEKIEALAATDE